MIKSTDATEASTLEYIKSLTLLCVEDNIDIQDAYKNIFQEFFKEIVFAKDGEDGYEKFISNEIDIVITDYSMPKLNGLDMITKIRISNKNIPIILITAFTEVDIIIKALQLNVNSFIKKPIELDEVVKALSNASKMIIAEQYIQDKQNSKIEALEAKNNYSSYQEDLAFAKQLNILRNDFYYQMLNKKCKVLVDFSYQPLDILSGDAYSARNVDNEKTFYLIVDGMGKGISASLSAILMTSYINHLIDKMQELSNFNLNRLIYESLEYIKPILLEDEALSVDFVILDCYNSTMHYAKFGMPSVLLQTKENEIIKLQSNNPPISKYMQEFKISSYNTDEISKFLIYSDGMVENQTRFKDKLYADFIEEDFLDSFTKENLREKLLWKIGTQEDDITFIFINKLNLDDTKLAQKEFSTSLEEVDAASEWYTNIWSGLTDDVKLIYSASIVFSELYMNAYEHGNLSIDSHTKNRLIEEDLYISTLQEMQKTSTKNIFVQINRINYNNDSYIVTQIKDEGDGFDTQILSRIFRNTKSFSGRGVYLSRNSSLGIYYNSQGNSVLFLHKL